MLEWDFIISKTLAHLKAESEYFCHGIFLEENASKKKREDDLWAYTSQYFPGIGTLKHCESRTLHKVPQILELLAGMELFVVVLYKQ